MELRASDAAPVSLRGLLLDDRYRLDQVRHEHTGAAGPRAVLWRAIDEPLGRRVAVLVVSRCEPAGRQRLLDAATRASRVGDGRCVRVLDVGEVDLADGPATWVATEWVDGPSLTAVLRGGPLRPPVATELVRQCAEALVSAERDGCRHGRLHPEQILLPGSGLPRITGLEVAAALHGESAPQPGDDVRGLGGLLFAALTGQWPDAGWTGLPLAAPQRPAGMSLWQLRPGVPREIDEVARRALSGGYPDARSVARALAALPTEPLDAPPAAPGRTWVDVCRTWVWRVGPPLLVVIVGVAGWVVGSRLGNVPTSARARQPALPPPSASAPGVGHLSLVWSSPPAITSFDPGGDGQENEDAVGLAVDRDPSTQWTTDIYRGDPHFGGLKDGVGLLIDLGRPVTVRVAELALSPAGADVEIRAGNVRPAKASDLTLVATRTDAPVQTRMGLAHGVSARYWLVWFTALPPSSGGYRVGVAEVALLG